MQAEEMNYKGRLHRLKIHSKSFTPEEFAVHGHTRSTVPRRNPEHSSSNNAQTRTMFRVPSMTRTR